MVNHPFIDRHSGCFHFVINANKVAEDFLYICLRHVVYAFGVWGLRGEVLVTGDVHSVSERRYQIVL